MAVGGGGLVNILGGVVFKKPPFSDFVELCSPANMRDSVDKLMSLKFPITTMEWGDYQPILVPLNADQLRLWIGLKSRARTELATQDNTDPLSQDEADNMRDLLDLAIRKCFNSSPPIPIAIEIGDSESSIHEIELVWEPAGAEIPTLLRLTMLCPPLP